MKTTVKIGDTEVPMMAMASTDIYYNRIFHKDAIRIQTQHASDEGVLINLFAEIGFVMAKQAELKDRKAMLDLTEDDYLEWLDQFDHGQYIDAIFEIGNIYNGQKKGTSVPKKTKGQ